MIIILIIYIMHHQYNVLLCNVYVSYILNWLASKFFLQDFILFLFFSYKNVVEVVIVSFLCRVRFKIQSAYYIPYILFSEMCS